MSVLRLAFCQWDVRFGQRDLNLRTLARLSSAVECDVLLLPELFTTGYQFLDREELLLFAENIPDGPTTAALMALAASKRCLVAGSFPEKIGDKIYNSAVAAGPDGILAVHRKLHLPRLEKSLFDSGGNLDVFVYKDTRMALSICFDVWFPETVRIQRKMGAVLLLHMGNFGADWTPDILRARALENHMVVLSSNRSGVERRLQFDARFRGQSRLIDPRGQIILLADGEEESCQVLSVDFLPFSDKKSDLLCDDRESQWSRYDLFNKPAD